MCKQLKNNKTRTTDSTRPKSDGMVKQFNGLFSQHLSEVIDKHRENWDLYSSIHAGISIFNSWEYPSYNSQGDIWPWIESAMWLAIQDTTRKANASQWICHGDKKSPKKNLLNSKELIMYCIRQPDEDLLQHFSRQPRIFYWTLCLVVQPRGSYLGWYTYI